MNTNIRKAIEYVYNYFKSGWLFLVPYYIVYLIYSCCNITNNQQPYIWRITNIINIYKIINILHVILIFLILYFKLRFRQNRNIIDTYKYYIPWLLIFLIIYIPGVYLEYPSDTWEHLSRIVHWDNNFQKQIFYKNFGYSIPYTFVINEDGVLSILRLNIYSAIISSILCYQYYLLAREVGLTKWISLFFVIIQLFTFGNSIFSFYRYYSISSTIYSQIAVIVVLRLLINYNNTFLVARKHSLILVIELITLISLISSTHLQGLLLIGIGFLSIVVQIVIKYYRRFIFLILFFVLLINILYLKYYILMPQNIYYTYVKKGILNSWYGFNILSYTSISFECSMQILGLFGIINIIASMFLIFKNHIVGWLSIMPILLLLQPIFICTFIKLSSPDPHILNRSFLIIPSGLALIYTIYLYRNLIFKLFYTNSYNNSYFQYILLIIILLYFTVIPEKFMYNRFWNAIAIVPKDISYNLLNYNSSINPYIHKDLINKEVLTTYYAGYVLFATGNLNITLRGRSFYNNSIINTNSIYYIKNRIINNNDNVIVIPSWSAFYTPFSLAALTSNHWLPQEGTFVSIGFSDIIMSNNMYHRLFINNLNIYY